MKRTVAILIAILCLVVVSPCAYASSQGSDEIFFKPEEIIAFSKKVENLWAAYALHFAYYNFCRIHRSLRITPAMEAGITDRVWMIADLLSA